MKIVIDCRFWGPKHTGLGRYTQNLVENLLAIDKKNHYFLLFRRKDINDLSIKQDDNLTVVPINIPHYSLKEQLLMPFLLQKIKPDLVHFPHFNVPIFWSGKYIVTIHDLIKHYSKGMETTTRQPWVYLFKYKGYRQVFSRAVKRAEKIIVPSNWVKRQLIKQYQISDEKIVTTYEGVDLKFKSKDKKLEKEEEILRKHGLKKPFIIYTGNLYPHKNLRRLILAIKSVNQSSSTNQALCLNLVVVCARDVFWQRLKKTIREFKTHSFVFLPGFISDQDLKVIYSQAKAFVSPSLMEGFGLPGLEAMASDCPVVCSNISVFKEIYAKAALYFNPKDINDIKEKIIKLMNLSPQERQKTIKRGKRQAEKYSWRECAQQTSKIYESCLSL